MKKVAKCFIKKFGVNSYAEVRKMADTYCVQTIEDNEILAIGKELKGYVGDIITTMYTGEKFGTGDFVLMSDRHGMICKFK